MTDGGHRIAEIRRRVGDGWPRDGRVKQVETSAGLNRTNTTPLALSLVLIDGREHLLAE